VIRGLPFGHHGRAIGESNAGNDDASVLYGMLENKILPLFYENREGWIKVMKASIGKNASFFIVTVLCRGTPVMLAYVREK
jgi:starch phosphorylase